MEKTKEFRSILKKYFPPELCVELESISRMMNIDNNGKTPYIREVLERFNVPYAPLGNGTNRYGIIVDGYAVKVALDRMGMTDNKREFKYAKKLYPSTVKVYECSPNGLLSVSEYITIFSLNDYYQRQDEMREILEEIAASFLIGDIGISKNNYANWGIRGDDSIAILDFAYIYSLSYKGFQCTCDDAGMLESDNDYNYYICPICKKKFSFGDIRKRITKQDEINEIGDIREVGYVLHSECETLPIDYEKSPDKKPKKKKKHENNNHEEEPMSSTDYELSMLEKVNAFIEGRSDSYL